MPGLSFLGMGIQGVRQWVRCYHRFQFSPGSMLQILHDIAPPQKHGRKVWRMLDRVLLGSRQPGVFLGINLHSPEHLD